MRTSIKTAAMAAAMIFAALPSFSETTSPMVANDPLMRQIMSGQLTQITGGITGAVRIGSGQAIALNLIDPLAPLKPVDGLVEKAAASPAEKPAAAKAGRKARRADEQLKKMSAEKRAADWTGRK